jgi:hypothetical protein
MEAMRQTWSDDGVDYWDSDPIMDRLNARFDILERTIKIGGAIIGALILSLGAIVALL